MANAKKSLSYFMRSVEPEIVQVPGPESFKDENGNVIMFEVKMLPQAEIQRIYRNYRKRTLATDKGGRPLIANGEVVWKTENDTQKATRHIIVEALVYPDLKDKELMDYYKCADVTEMPLLVFSNPNEYLNVTRAVLAALGLRDDEVDADDAEDAKN